MNPASCSSPTVSADAACSPPALPPPPERRARHAIEARRAPWGALQLFFQGKELRSDLYDALTLNLMNLHTGFSVNGYDLVRCALFYFALSSPLALCNASSASS